MLLHIQQFQEALVLSKRVDRRNNLLAAYLDGNLRGNPDNDLSIVLIDNTLKGIQNWLAHVVCVHVASAAMEVPDFAVKAGAGERTID